MNTEMIKRTVLAIGLIFLLFLVTIPYANAGFVCSDSVCQNRTSCLGLCKDQEGCFWNASDNTCSNTDPCIIVMCSGGTVCEDGVCVTPSPTPTPTPTPSPTSTPTPTPSPVPFMNCSFEPNLCLCQGKGKNLFEIPCDDTAAIEKCEASTRGKEGGRVLRLIEDDASKFNIDCECDCPEPTPTPTPTPEPTGACCGCNNGCDDNFCGDGLTRSECESDNGVYSGDDTFCSPLHCGG